MSIHDAQTLVRLNPTTVRLTVNAKESTRTSHNLVVTLPGDIEDEIICFSGHYDSVRHSKGVYDNATGALAVLDFLKYFSQKKPKRTLKFLWLGTEERGLIGATQYVKTHQETIDQYKLNINLDMLGVVLGKDIACVTGEEAITHYIDFVAKELNFAIKTSTGVYPSDSTPFADGGVPAIQRFVIIPLFLFGGAFYPLSQLPEAVQWFARAFPLWHGVVVARGFTTGDTDWAGVAGHLAYVLLWAAVGTAISIRRLARRLYP